MCVACTSGLNVCSLYQWFQPVLAHTHALYLCPVVFMDEAGLPEESHESLKVCV